MPVQLIDCIFEGNTASGTGGAVGGIGGGVSISGCRFTTNTANEGGAVHLSHGALVMEFSTFAGNSATVGGALFLDSLAELDLNHCSFYGNAALQGGAVNLLGAYNSTQNLSCSILAFGLDGEALYWDTGGTLGLDHLDIHGNAGGNWVGDIADQYDLDGNIDRDPLFCDASAGDFTLRADSPCLPAGNPDSVLIGAHGQGCEAPTGLPATANAGVAKLRGAHPNPFNPQVTIHFEIPIAGRASLRIFGSDGRLVAVLADRPFAAGRQNLIWDGEGATGAAVSSGIYHAVLDCAGQRTSMKLVLLR